MKESKIEAQLETSTHSLYMKDGDFFIKDAEGVSTRLSDIKPPTIRSVICRGCVEDRERGFNNGQLPSAIKIVDTWNDKNMCMTCRDCASNIMLKTCIEVDGKEVNVPIWPQWHGDAELTWPNA